MLCLSTLGARDFLARFPVSVKSCVGPALIRPTPKIPAAREKNPLVPRVMFLNIKSGFELYSRWVPPRSGWSFDGDGVCVQLDWGHDFRTLPQRSVIVWQILMAL